MTWENYQSKYNVNTTKMPFVILQGDFMVRNLLWSTKEQKVNVIDFEYLDMGHPGMDLGYIFMYSSRAIRAQFMEPALKRYYAKVVDAGKIVEKEYSFEQFRKEVFGHAVAKGAFLQIVASYVPLPEPEFIEMILTNFNDFCEEHPEVKTYDYPHAFMVPTCPLTVTVPEY